MNQDRGELLESLLTHEGWLLFTEHCRQEWGPNGARYQAELDKALDLTDAEAAASQARQIRAARRMVETLLTWPSEEIARLKRVEERPAAVMSRGGYSR